MTIIDYRNLYQNFLEIEQDHEQLLWRELPDFAPSPWDAVSYANQFKLSWLEFQDLLWHCRHQKHLLEWIAPCGSINSAVSLAMALSQHEIVQVEANGALKWRERLFPQLPTLAPGFESHFNQCVAAFKCNPRWGQIRVDSVSSMKRVDRFLELAQPHGRKVLFLGDDDFTSLILAAKSGCEVHVIDRDPGVLAFLKETADKLDVSLCIESHNVLTPLPAHLTKTFDAVFMDPIDEAYWLTVWLKRAIEALLPISGTRLAISVSPHRLGKRWAALQRYQAEQGFVLESRLEHANRYSIFTELGPFYTSYRQRPFESILDKALNSGALAIYTDFIIFKRTLGEWPMYLGEFRELRRSI
jgi:hypothetical protein